MGAHIFCLVPAHRLNARRAFFGFVAGVIGVLAGRQCDPHAATGKAFWFAEQTQITIGHLQGVRYPFESDPLLFQAAIDHGRSVRLAARCVNRQAKNGARVQLKFGLALGA